MLLGGGTLIEIIEARTKPLERVLKDCINRRFTGYVVFRNDVQGTYISIALVKGNIVACRAIDRGIVYEGAECSDSAMKYLFQPEGVIEVFEAQDSVIVFDIVVFPMSRMERKTSLITRLGTEIGIPIPAPATVPQVVEAAKPTPIAMPEVMAPKLEVEKEVTEVKPPVEAVEKEPEIGIPKVTPAPQTLQPTVEAEISISNDCIDPVTLYRVVRSAQLLETMSQALSLPDIVQKVKSILREGKLSYLYISGGIENLSLRILYDAQTNSINIELEKDGTVLCGGSAIRELENKYASGIKIWFIQ